MTASMDFIVDLFIVDPESSETFIVNVNFKSFLAASNRLNAFFLSGLLYLMV